MALSLTQTRLYNCWQLTNKESGHCQPSPPPPPPSSSFFYGLSVYIYIYISFAEARPLGHVSCLIYIQPAPAPPPPPPPSLNSNIDLPSRRQGPKLRVHHVAWKNVFNVYDDDETGRPFSLVPPFALRQLLFFFFHFLEKRKKKVEPAIFSFCFFHPFNPVMLYCLLYCSEFQVRRAC